MFLIPEESTPQLKGKPQPSGSRVSTVEHPDSIAGVEFFLKQFSTDEKLNYPLGATGLRGEIWADMVRNIGLATVQVRSVHQQAGYSSQEFPVIDWLASRFLERLFQEQYGHPNGAQFKIYTGNRAGLNKSFREVSFWDLISELNSVPFKALQEKSQTFTVYREFQFQAVGKRQKLIFEVLLDRGTVVDLKLSKRSRSVNPEGDRVLADVRAILQDQRERVSEAKRCLDTPLALGPSPELAYSIVGKLSDLGFPAGSYSRSSLGAGVFPQPRYSHKVLAMETQLVFVHCERCHSLSAITAEKASGEQMLGLTGLSRDLISPWHGSICGKSAAEIQREDRLKLAMLDERQRIRDRKNFLQRKRDLDYYRQQKRYSF